MHGTLLAFALAVYLLAPSSLLGRLWSLASGRTEPPSSTALQKEGPGLDPYGALAPAPRTEAGPGLDPSGATALTTEEGPGLDPFGRS